MIPQMQDILSMLRTLQQNSNLTAYTATKGKFDWNKTLIVLLKTKAMLYIATNARTTFAPHFDKMFVTGMAPHHYRLLKFFVPETRGYHILGTYRLDPAHWTLPTVSETDRTVLVATELLENLEMMPPPLV